MTLVDSHHLCLNPERALLCGNLTPGASWNGNFDLDVCTYICYRSLDIHPCIRNMRSHTGIFNLMVGYHASTGTCNASKDLSILIVLDFWLAVQALPSLYYTVIDMQHVPDIER